MSVESASNAPLRSNEFIGNDDDDSRGSRPAASFEALYNGVIRRLTGARSRLRPRPAGLDRQSRVDAARLESRLATLERHIGLVGHAHNQPSQFGAAQLRERRVTGSGANRSDGWDEPRLPAQVHVVDAAPVTELLYLLAERHAEDLASVCDAYQLDNALATRLLDGSQSELSMPEVQEVCEALEANPFQLFGAQAGWSILAAYPPELWPDRQLRVDFELDLPPGPLGHQPPDLGGCLGLDR